MTLDEWNKNNIDYTEYTISIRFKFSFLSNTEKSVFLPVDD